jgi:hypothetical protein
MNGWLDCNVTRYSGKKTKAILEYGAFIVFKCLSIYTKNCTQRNVPTGLVIYRE